MAGMYYQQNLGDKEEKEKEEDHSSSDAEREESWTTNLRNGNFAVPSPFTNVILKSKQLGITPPHSKLIIPFLDFQSVKLPSKPPQELGPPNGTLQQNC